MCSSDLLGMLISATSATAAEAVSKTVLLSTPLIQLSGFAFPVRNMATPFRWFAEIIPATHYIRLSRAIYLRGEGPLALLPEIAVIVAGADPNPGHSRSRRILGGFFVG